jgi:hypothetical protein
MNISDRLPAALKKEPIWVELMECFEELMAPLMSRVEDLENSNSMFTASDINLDLMIEESGQVFDVEWNSPENKPLAVLRRKDELKFKTTAIPIESMLNRAFIGLSSYWDQYYCKKDAVYSVVNFTTKDSIAEQGGALSDYFLTSRGFLRIDTATMLERGISQADVIEVIDGQLANIIPLHIVFDGIRFILSALIGDMSINASAVIQPAAKSVTASNGVDTKAKEVVSILSADVDTMNVYANHHFLNFDDASLDFWPLDMPLSINDGLTIVDTPVTNPMPLGQLGDGSVIPQEEKQLGDGSKPPSESIQLSEI